MSTFLVCTGTRPEIVKMAPVHRALRARGHRVCVLHTGQHEAMAESLYRFFDMPPDARLQLARRQATLSHLTAELLAGVHEQVQALDPDVLLVQGDTTSALVGAMVGFYQDRPVAHIEAGLRTGEHDPFPEEKNRELIGRLVQWHFPPTPQARRNLLREGLDGRCIHEVGNTVIDAALWACAQLQRDGLPSHLPPDVQQFLQQQAHPQLVLVTAHRRENWGRPMQRIAAAVAGLLQLHPQLTVVWPLHPNPQVRADVHTGLASLAADSRSRLLLTEPLDYPALIGLLQSCLFTLTDSGGIQEEASALHKPVLVLRESTERQELVQAGGASLVGTQAHQIVEQASELLQDPMLLEAMCVARSPFGDGHAAERIAQVLCRSTQDQGALRQVAA
jgi:UDP-N-acetylglucosamine 2-epimerase (non-hydrolysing)/UDP-N-acetylglucosamine 2-epimerase (hydrolysing)